MGAQAEALAATRRLAESLESEVAARTVELTKEVRPRSELEEKLQRALEVERAAREVQRDFVGMVSHEFRTPLSIIDAAAPQLRSRPDAPPRRQDRPQARRLGHRRERPGRGHARGSSLPLAAPLGTGPSPPFR